MPERIEWGGARVRATRDLTHDIRLIEIEPQRFVAPAPGSHINVRVPLEGRDDTRSYSVVGSCTDGIYRIAVKRLKDSRGGSAFMWTLQPGAVLDVSPPVNNFALNRGRPHYLLVAGGIGITPIYTQALALAEQGASVRVLYGCRNRGDAALADVLRERLGERIELFVSEEGRRIDLRAAVASLPDGGELYVCGPIPMLEEAKRAWQDSGRPVDQLRIETFGSSGQFAAQAFTVEIPRLGKRVEVPANQSLLEALEESGVEMIFDCRRGECGLCALPILAVDGVVDHRDVFFSEAEKAENSKLCTCVSRVVGRSITLDTADR
jgi:vanillate O-demethylase ferredoxin subunit